MFRNSRVSPPCITEIRECVPPGGSATDIPAIVDRVFKLKLDALIEDLTKNRVLSLSVAFIHTIEFQKRGLPHAHILVILAPEDKIGADPAKIDTIVSAELPDKTSEPMLYELVLNHMVHGPCGIHNPNASCMVGPEGSKRCRHNFPFAFADETTVHDGRPLYRRRDLPGRRAQNSRGDVIDSRWIASYNKYLTLRYQAHINVAVVSSTHGVKYIYKYITKVQFFPMSLFPSWPVIVRIVWRTRSKLPEMNEFAVQRL